MEDNRTEITREIIRIKLDIVSISEEDCSVLNEMAQRVLE